MTSILKSGKTRRILCMILMIVLVVGIMAAPCLADGNGDVAGAVESTWNSAKSQIKDITNKVIFPVIDMILAILFFVKVGTAYFDYRKHGQFEFAAPCILFACLIFSLTAPLYIWNIVG
ncbi:MAG: DUF3852 domain-containing protein [Clostridiales bacterium]|nr:DUF3852 domain-containing protein [Clostridiales bacterium]